MLTESLTCGCTPGKTYANRASLRRHQQTQKHVEFCKRDEERGLRVRLAEAEAELAKVKADFERLSDYVRFPKKRAVTTRMKKEVAARAGWKCQLCSETVNANYEIDHILPLYRGGDNAASNLQCLCPDCHRTKTAAEGW